MDIFEIILSILEKYYDMIHFLNEYDTAKIRKIQLRITNDEQGNRIKKT